MVVPYNRYMGGGPMSGTKCVWRCSTVLRPPATATNGGKNAFGESLMELLSMLLFVGGRWTHHAGRTWGSWLAFIKLSWITSGTPLVTGVLAAFSLLMLLADKRSSKENTWTKHHQHPLPLSQQWNPQLVSHTSLSCSTKPLCIRIWFGGRRWSQMQKLRKDVFSARKMADRMFSRSGSVWVVVIFLYATQNGRGKCIITAFRNTMLRRRFH